ncbi:MAG: ribonuclease HI family protein [Candidatus Aenigmarchaeota archaeon]|nr:ribonuclease HI family protein [Candidatus Aenigmarchaeota archaeon]
MGAEKIGSLHIYTDGGSRGNPGNAAVAFTIYDSKGKIVSEKSESIGIRTNNFAEYTALILALKEAVKYCHGKVFCFSDSEIMVRQLNGVYKVKVKHLKELNKKVKELEKMFEQATYKHLPRTNPRISRVDKLLNKELDKLKITSKAGRALYRK